MRKYTSLFLVSTTVFLTAFTSLASADAKIDHRKSSTATVRCHVPTKAKVAALFERWNKSLLTGDPAKVVANCAPDAVLLPTLSKKVRYTQKEREDYFRGFLKKKPVGHIDRAAPFAPAATRRWIRAPIHLPSATVARLLPAIHSPMAGTAKTG